MEHLIKKYIPQEVVVELSCNSLVLSAAKDELQAKASRDEFKCFGYFPGMQTDASTLEFDLPACKEYASQIPTITVKGKEMEFGFLRMSLIEQKGISPYHVDSDASAALSGDIARVSKKYIWRLLLNMSEEYQRTLSYLDIDPMSVELVNKSGYIHYPQVDESRMQYISIPPRQDKKVHGVLFCASRVLHAGRDDEHGHFVAGYGCEE